MLHVFYNVCLRLPLVEHQIIVAVLVLAVLPQHAERHALLSWQLEHAVVHLYRFEQPDGDKPVGDVLCLQLSTLRLLDKRVDTPDDLRTIDGFVGKRKAPKLLLTYPKRHFAALFGDIQANQAHKPLAVELQLGFADAVDAEKRTVGGRELAAHIAQRSVRKDDIGRHAALFGDRGAFRLQLAVELAVRLDADELCAGAHLQRLTRLHLHLAPQHQPAGLRHLQHRSAGAEILDISLLLERFYQILDLRLSDVLHNAEGRLRLQAKAHDLLRLLAAQHIAYHL